MISNQKKKLLHVAKRELKLTDQQYVYVLIEHTGKMSSADPAFTDADFKKVIDHFKAMGFWIARGFKQERPRDAGDMITKPQQKVIEHLWSDLAEHLQPAHMMSFRQGFHQRVIKRPWPQTRAEANHVIEALKNRVQRAMQQHAKDRYEVPL